MALTRHFADLDSNTGMRKGIGQMRFEGHTGWSRKHGRKVTGWCVPFYMSLFLLTLIAFPHHHTHICLTRHASTIRLSLIQHILCNGLAVLLLMVCDNTNYNYDTNYYNYLNRTVEVNNTDAEGRLVLGDGVRDTFLLAVVLRWLCTCVTCMPI